MKRYLINHIWERGPIGVDEFMALALGHPEHGYYMKKDPFGAAGDFTTAPEISQMFGEILGAWTADLWMRMGAPGKFTLLECGPGRGTLMADMLRAAAGVEGFHAAAEIHLLETSPVLREMQGKALAGRAVWHETLEAVPHDKPVIVIANEFLDALPVRQFVREGGRWIERVVDYSGEGFEFRGEGEIQETSPARAAFISELCAIMKKAGGAALFIDYGHEKTAPGDTLQAVYKHKYVSPLEHIGDADLTAHVDFQALREAAENAGAAVSGLVGQGIFLKSLGIEARAAYLSARADEKGRVDIQSALKRLTDSDQMGSLFKVMGLRYGQGFDLAGF